MALNVEMEKYEKQQGPEKKMIDIKYNNIKFNGASQLRPPA